MKKIRLLAILLFAIATLHSCVDDVASFEASEITGKWQVREVSNTGEQTYEVEIIEDTSVENGLILKNFYDWKEDVKATYDLDFNITIPSQSFDGLTISGKGLVGDNYKSIDWTYSVVHGEGAIAESLSATYSPPVIAVIPDLSLAD